MNELRDQLAAAQLDLDRRDQEIDELNGELDAKIREQESHAAQVAADWEDEVAQTRDQIDGLKDVSRTVRARRWRR
jgi:chromosome segregation ATPase